MNPYLDSNYVDRTEQIESDFDSTLKEISEDPQFCAELLNDLLYHWVYGTRETAMMVMAKKVLLERHGI
jgi:hypothetical protein